MQQELESCAQKMILDTDRDICLYSAPRPSAAHAGSCTRGRDLYLHRHKKAGNSYYFHCWTLNQEESESIRVVSPVMAERFLQQRGLTCRMLPDSDASAILLRWGYGILEEF